MDVRVDVDRPDNSPQRAFLLTFSDPTATAPTRQQTRGRPARRIEEEPTGVLSTTLDVRVDYAAFEDAYGGSWDERLQVTAYPACFLTTPKRPGCATGVPVDFTNETDASRLEFTTVDEAVFADQFPNAPTDTGETDTASVTPNSNGASRSALGAERGVAARASAGGAVYSVGGSGGNYGAEPVQPSAAWQVGAGSGEFMYSYPFTLPTALGGDTPQLSLDYSSGSVDAMSLAENGQASPSGIGWDMSTAMVTREYSSCKDDGFSSKGDLCWKTRNGAVVDDYTIVLNGVSSPLIRIGSTETFRLRQDSAWKVELLKNGAGGAVNGDNNTEAFLVTTPDGTKYWFGRSTDSTLTVPVFADVAGEQCYGSGSVAGDRWCQQGYKWLLTRVLDARGNETLYTYDKEANYYARWGNTTSTVKYDSAATLSKIEYGFARTTTNSVPRQIINVFTGTRCTKDIDENDAGATCSPTLDGPTQKPNLWPDVPTDLICNAGQTCLVGSPTFFSLRRYTKLVTKTNQGTGANQVARVVDTYDLGYTMPDPDGTGPDQPDLWLSSVQRTGTGQTGDKTLPAIRFFGTDPLQNRVVVQTGERTLKKYRVGAVRTERGGWIDVTYGHDDGHNCDAPYVNAQTRWSSERECFSQKYAPPGGTARWEWFNKYVVTRLALGDNALAYRYGDPASSTTKLGSLRVYDYDYRGDPAWRYVDNRSLAADERAWTDWRGYARTVVITRSTKDNNYQTGTTDVSQTHIVRFRGLDGTLKNPDTGVKRDERIDTDEITDNTTEQKDSPWYEGLTAESSLKTAGGNLISRTYTNYSAVPTAIDPNGQDGRFVYPAKVLTRTPTSSNDYLTEIITTVDPGTGDPATNTGVRVGTELTRQTRGWRAGSATDEYQLCVKNDWLLSQDNWIRVPQEVTTYGSLCAASTNLLANTRNWYDSMEPGGTGTTLNKGNLTQSLHYLTPDKSKWEGEKYTYDPLGRVTAATHSYTDTYPGATQTTTYNTTGTTGSYDDLLTRITSTSPTTPTLPSGLTTVTNLDTRRGTPTDITDPNGFKTDIDHDPIGRVAAVYLPNVGTAGKSIEYNYLDSINTPGRVTTIARRGTGAVDTSYTFYDGWGRVIENQRRQPDVTNYARTVSAIGYDEQGLAEYQLPAFAASATSDPGVVNAEPATVEQYSRTLYDAARRPVSVKDLTLGTVLRETTTSYTGDKTTVTPPAPLGATITTTDSMGNTKTVALTDNAGTTTLDKADYTYTPLNELQSLKKTYTTPATTQTWSWDYDLLRRPTKAVDPDTGTTITAYNGIQDTTVSRYQNTSGTLGAALSVIKTNYDNLSRPISRIDQTPGATIGTVAFWNYDTATNGLGLLASSNSVTGLGTFTDAVTSYDTLGKPLTVVAAYPANLTGETATRKSQPSLANPDQAQKQTTYTYNLAGDISTIAYPRIDAPTGTAALLRATDLSLNYTDNRLVSGIKATVAADTAAGQSAETVWLGQYAYNALAQVRSLTSSSVTNSTRPALERTWTWDNASGWPNSFKAANPAAANPWLRLTYNRNTATGQITSIDRTATQPNAAIVNTINCYTYDPLNRLTRAVDTTQATQDHCDNGFTPSTATTATYDYTYSYDQDRLATVTSAAGPSSATASYTYDGSLTTGSTSSIPVHRYKTISRSGTSSTDLALLPPGSSYTWDGLGRATNVTRSSAPELSTTTSYDNQDRPIRVVFGPAPTTTTTLHAYKADGIRVARRVTASDKTTTTIYLPNGIELTAVTPSGGSLQLKVARHNHYADDGTLLADQTSTGFTWLVADTQGSVRSTITDAANPAVTQHTFSPYGDPVPPASNPLTDPIGTPNQRGYLGKIHDPGGDIRLDHRTYTPATALFTTPDPVLVPVDPQSANPYSYARFNPVGASDPSGLVTAPDNGGGQACSYNCDAVSEGHQDELEDLLSGAGNNELEHYTPPIVHPLGVPSDQAANAAALSWILHNPDEVLKAIITGTIHDAVACGQGSVTGCGLTIATLLPFVGQAVRSGTGAIRAARAAEAAEAAAVAASARAGSATRAVEAAKAEAGSIRGVNPLRGTENCVNCAIATDSTLAGAPMAALNSGPTSIATLERFYGGTFKPVSGQAEIERLLAQAGSGARGIIYGGRTGDVGHVFNGVNQGGVVRFLDGQTGGGASFRGYDSFMFLRTN